jgi:hypothetical protein
MSAMRKVDALDKKEALDKKDGGRGSPAVLRRLPIV